MRCELCDEHYSESEYYGICNECGERREELEHEYKLNEEEFGALRN